MTEIFEPGLVERLQGQYPQVDVRMVAAEVRDMATRKLIERPGGLLVSMVRKRALAAVGNAPMSDADRERHSQFTLRLYARLATEQLTPRQVADVLAAAISSGMKFSALLVLDLRRMGDHWPSPADLGAAAVDSR